MTETVAGAKVFEGNDPINTENLNGRALEANDCYTKAGIVTAPGSTDLGMGASFFTAGQLVLGRGGATPPAGTRDPQLL